MLNFNVITIKNFMSVGNVTQSVRLDSPVLTLVLGENMDLGGQDNRNGVGKTTLVNALSFALYGRPLVNVKLDNLINKANLKGMLVTLSFNINGVDYRIERGRKPAVFRLFKNGAISSDDEADDSAQGENRHTQEELEQIISLSHDMFKHIVALNTYVEPFLSMKSADQRIIIEQLLGITKLSEKAEKLKVQIKDTKDLLHDEEIIISSKKDANSHIENSIRALKRSSDKWEADKVQKISALQDSITSLMDLDITAELAAHEAKKTITELNSEYKSLNRELKGYVSENKSLQSSLAEVGRLIVKTHEGVCPTCAQTINDEQHEHLKSQYADQAKEFSRRAAVVSRQIKDTEELISNIKDSIPEDPVTFYSSLSEAYNHKTQLDTQAARLHSLIESANPYTEQIKVLEETGLQTINYDKINELTRLKEHQDFLLKLLTNKDSFVRKRIIEQNIMFLNSRLAYYLNDIGLPHSVKFLSDLEVEITQYGKEFDFDNLSRGERTRLVLSLSWAFRDVFESIYGKINLMFIDELVDQGLDTAGADSVLKILKGMSRNSNKSVFLISHKEEYISRIDNILKVVKENNFTSFEAGEATECTT